MSQKAKLCRWADLPSDSPLPLLSRKRVIGENVMISRVHLEKGCFVAMHSHENEQMAFVHSGCLRFGLEGPPGTTPREVLVHAGEVLHLPPFVPHSAEAIEETVVYDVFSPPSRTTGIDQPQTSAAVEPTVTSG